MTQVRCTALCLPVLHSLTVWCFFVDKVLMRCSSHNPKFQFCFSENSSGRRKVGCNTCFNCERPTRTNISLDSNTTNNLQLHSNTSSATYHDCPGPSVGDQKGFLQHIQLWHSIRELSPRASWPPPPEGTEQCRCWYVRDIHYRSYFSSPIEVFPINRTKPLQILYKLQKNVQRRR